LFVFWLLGYLLAFSLVYFVFARIRQSRVPHESWRATDPS
jgi:hypothetical protein